jgi:hypothetical protein
MEKLECGRRVSKSPKLGGTEADRRAYTITDPPPFYHPWLRKGLRKRAREMISTEWIGPEKRAQIRWAATSELATWETEKAEHREEVAEESEATVRARLGGKVGAGDAIAPLPANTLLTMTMYDAMTWTKEAMRSNGWTVKAVQNQLKLRNLSERQALRSAEELALLSTRGLLATKDKLRVSASSAAEYALLLKRVLEAEAAAAAAAAAIAQSAARQDQQSTSRSRQSRPNRGQNRHAPS